jgi:protein-tyrosine phosphatase
MIKTDVYWIQGPWSGRLATSSLPFGGAWLEDDMASWRQEGVDIVVSLLTQAEIKDADLGQQPESCSARGMEMISFPIWDRSVPSSREEVLELVRYLDRKLREEKKILIHCRAGIGRSSLLAACLLVYSGLDWEAALQNISRVRGCPVPDTLEQRDWVAKFARFLRDLPDSANSISESHVTDDS